VVLGPRHVVTIGLGQCEKNISCLDGALCWLIALQASQLFGDYLMDPSSTLAKTDLRKKAARKLTTFSSAC